MIPEEVIRSGQNVKLKAIRALKSGKHREYTLLEGQHLLSEALSAQAEIEWVLISDQLSMDIDFKGVPTFFCEDSLMSDVSYLDSPSGVMAWVRRPEKDWRSQISKLSHRQWGLIAVGIQDPGNMGALTRVAAGLGAEFLIVTKGATSPWHPRAVRGASGTTFRIPVYEGVDVDDLLSELESKDIVSWGACSDGTPLPSLNQNLANQKTVVLMGEEGQGLSEDCLARCSARVGITLRRDVESLNVATAAAILGYHLDNHV
jgi:TrmH family RNA methyltransferase